jgi:lactoylglutathione lyase
VFVQDMDRSVAFYSDVLGLPLKFQSSHWTEFATDGATLALHLADAAASAAAASSGPGSCRPGFSTANLDAFHVRMTAQGVTCLQEPKSIFGSRVAQYADPDGLAFSVGEERQP